MYIVTALATFLAYYTGNEQPGLNHNPIDAYVSNLKISSEPLPCRGHACEYDIVNAVTGNHWQWFTNNYDDYDVINIDQKHALIHSAVINGHGDMINPLRELAGVNINRLVSGYAPIHLAAFN